MMAFCVHEGHGFPSRWISVVIFASLVLLTVIQGITSTLQSKGYQHPDKRSPQRCIPQLSNAALNKSVISNNTCGVPPTKFCFLTGSQDGERKCEVCDASNPRYAHPASLITDATKAHQSKTWWQSQSLLENTQPVSLTLDLGKSFEVAYIRIRFQSPRPESMAIYKKISYDRDAKWIPFQYFSASCKQTYKVDSYSGVAQLRKKALCSKRFSSLTPLTGGNVVFNTLENRPDAFDFDNSPSLQDWVTAVSIRIDLDRMNTFGDEVFGDPNVLRSYYFAMIDLSVVGRCKCNGHADRCVKRSSGELGKIRQMCDCKHNTGGVDCEKCLPLYNDKRWARASPSNPNICMPCNCNNNADKCVYDEKRFKETGHGGVCVNCKRNTAGPNCEKCKKNFFRKRLNDTCLFCNCNPIGSESLQCGSDGQCNCKPGVIGVKCDRCQPSYVGFSSTGCRCQNGYYGDPSGSKVGSTRCKKCNCSGNIAPNAIGSCDPKSGACLKCIHSTRNGPLEKCELCDDGFYGNATHYPKPQCKACNCNPYGSLNVTCNEFGVCKCRAGAMGTKCNSCRQNYHNLKAGCTYCPLCSVEMQNIADSIRRKVKELISSISSHYNKTMPH